MTPNGVPNTSIVILLYEQRHGWRVVSSPVQKNRHHKKGIMLDKNNEQFDSQSRM